MRKAELEAEKAASTGQLLFRCARLWNEQALARWRAQSGVDIRPAHTALFPHIDLEGTRLTDLAQRVGTSKQAVAQLVDELEAMGGLERVPDPSDGRAKLVRFARGGAALLEGLGLLMEMEAELADAIGSSRMAALHDALTTLLPYLEQAEGPARDGA
jgi:DNA-binding MarR family transcriptional regulator